MMFNTVPVALPLIRSGKLKALSVAASERSPELPGVPTTTEAGVADSDYIFWVAILALFFDVLSPTLYLLPAALLV